MGAFYHKSNLEIKIRIINNDKTSVSITIPDT